MVQPYQTTSEHVKSLNKIEKERYEVQSEFREKLEAYTVEAKERIKKEKSAILAENMRIEIRNWVKNFFQQTGKIPELPSVESGGSRVIFSRQVGIWKKKRHC